MVSSCSSSSTTSMFPPIGGMLADWAIDKRPVQAVVFNAIGQTAKKLNGLAPVLVNLVVDYLEVHREQRGGIFGERDWAAHFGSVPPAPALPLGIEEIWQSPCPIYSRKRISDTHVFVYLPATVNGQPLTLNSLGILAKKYFPETDAGYQCTWPDLIEKLGDEPIGNSCWTLMTNRGLPGTKDQFFNVKKKMVADFAEKTVAPYEIPRTLDATVCILAQYASSKIRLFSDTFTNCQENIYDDDEDYRNIVGKFEPSGLRVDTYDGNDFAVAAVRKFFPMEGMLTDWTFDKRHTETAVFNTISLTKKKLDGLPSPLVSLVVDYLEVHREQRGGIFGEKEWADHFKAAVPPAPALPSRIEEIWQSPCPIYSEKRISETHMFVYLPATVNGQPLTLKSLGILAKQYFPENENGYRTGIAGYIIEEIGNKPVENPCWLLMTNDVLPGSRGEGNKKVLSDIDLNSVRLSFKDQQKMVTALARKTLAAYEVPKALDAAVCILARFASSKIRLFGTDPMTYTRCQENAGELQVIVGAFFPAGLAVRNHSDWSGTMGIAAFRRF